MEAQGGRYFKLLLIGIELLFFQNDVIVKDLLLIGTNCNYRTNLKDLKLQYRQSIVCDSIVLLHDCNVTSKH